MELEVVLISYEGFQLGGVNGRIYFLLALQGGDVCIKPL